jgi:L,D-transpeptidase-like protein
MAQRRWAVSLALPVALLCVLPRVGASEKPPADPLISPGLAAAAERSGLHPDVLRLALRARARAAAMGLASRPVVTVIDYRLPSRERRLWVLDLARGVVLAHELVAHGRETGDDLARRFSNRPGSLQSSLGTFLTGETYRGTHGLSLRLHGLDAGLNDQAEARALVVHGADYVGPRIVAKLGRLGRSHGCPALSPDAARRVIGLIRGGTVLFAYYPSPAMEQALATRW